jgi:hypothetical protein
MSTTTVHLDNDVIALLHGFNQPVQQAVCELIVLELYRRGTISSGKAAGLLGMSRIHFIEYASRLDIPLFEMTGDEWGQEHALSETL